MTVKDDLPSEEVAKKREVSRLASKRYDDKVSRKKKHAKRSSARATAIAAKSTIKVQVAMENALEFGPSVGFSVASKFFTDCKGLREPIEGKFTEWKRNVDPPWNSQGHVVLDEGKDERDCVPTMYVNQNYGHPKRLFRG